MLHHQLRIYDEPDTLVMQLDSRYAVAMRRIERFAGTLAAGSFALWLLQLWLQQSKPIYVELLYLAVILGLVALLCPRPLARKASFNLRTREVVLQQTAKRRTTSRTVSFAEVASLGLVATKEVGETELESRTVYAVVLRMRDGSEFTVADALPRIAGADQRLTFVSLQTGIARLDC